MRKNVHLIRLSGEKASIANKQGHYSQTDLSVGTIGKFGHMIRSDIRTQFQVYCAAGSIRCDTVFRRIIEVAVLLYEIKIAYIGIKIA